MNYDQWTDQEIGWAFFRAIGRNVINFIVAAIVYAFVWWAGRISVFMGLLDDDQRIVGMLSTTLVLAFWLGLRAKNGGRWLTRNIT